MNAVENLVAGQVKTHHSPHSVSKDVHQVSERFGEEGTRGVTNTFGAHRVSPRAQYQCGLWQDAAETPQSFSAVDLPL